MKNIGYLRDVKLSRRAKRLSLRPVRSKRSLIQQNGSFKDRKYYFYVRDHLGNNRVVTDQTATAVQSTQYYPFGMAFAISTGQDGQRFKYNDKELDLMHGLNMYDYSARGIDMVNPRFTTQDPLAEKYYSISPYAYCANNPMKYIDPTGMEFDLSGMTKEEKEEYEKVLGLFKGGSNLFDALYESLEDSEKVYKIGFGKTKTGAPGEIDIDKSGNATITFKNIDQARSLAVIGEEFFHAYQNENKAKYGGEFNKEFEARVFTTAAYVEISKIGDIYNPEYNGMQNFQKKIIDGDFGDGEFIPLIHSQVISDNFVTDYKKAANVYAKFNIVNMPKDAFLKAYKTATTVDPYSLQRIVKKAYGEN